MIIEIFDVERTDPTGKNGKTYGLLTIAYKNDGKLLEKKLMSFNNPDVFKVLNNSTKGDLWDVKAEKIGDYIQWTSITKSTGEASPDSVSKGVSAATRVTGSNYETADERAVKQRYIVRQSSLTTALGILSVGAKAINSKDVIELAKTLEEWVFRLDEQPKGLEAIDKLEDDIPY